MKIVPDFPTPAKYIIELGENSVEHVFPSNPENRSQSLCELRGAFEAFLGENQAQYVGGDWILLILPLGACLKCEEVGE